MAENVKEMVLLPYDLVSENQRSAPDETSINNSNVNANKVIKRKNKSNNNNKAIDKNIRIIRLALILANNNSFNSELNIRSNDGSYNKNSNLPELLSLTQQKAKNIDGVDDLIQQLFLAKVDPDLIINTNIRSRLLNLYNDKPVQASVEIVNEIRPAKRKHIEENNSESFKKNASWVIPFNEDEDRGEDEVD